MRIIKPSTLAAYGTQYPKARKLLAEWKALTKAVTWTSYPEVRKMFGKADRATVASGKPVVIFDIGAHFRLITAIHYNTGRVYVLGFMTHEQYNGEKWKKRW